VLNAKL